MSQVQSVEQLRLLLGDHSAGVSEITSSTSSLQSACASNEPSHLGSE